ncbi:MAG: dephospho-CoA kinase [Rhodobacteraceae bacterium]|nr:dephospho-CoA kinase [Paracoccaceae bacterium]MCY4327966.1 dephospho-CoA kinase [Paracoccaceae bacterium]
MTSPLFCLGLTGSIGMGKSTAGAVFSSLDIPVWDADQAVARIYSSGDSGSRALAVIVPEAVPDPKGPVCKERLKEKLAQEPGLLRDIEEAIHPLVHHDRQQFVEQAAETGSDLVVCEVPLLFESGSAAEFDAVAVVSTSAAQQENRVMRRAGMTRERFRTFRDRQMSDSEKRRLADYVIRSCDIQTMRSDVTTLVRKIRELTG